MTQIADQSGPRTMPTNRRAFERFALPTAYTPMSVRLLGETTFDLEGHAYDISEGGVRFELDEPIPAGTPVAVKLELPGLAEDSGPGRAIFATGNVVWIDDEDVDIGPARMAIAFTMFSRAGDRERLLAQLGQQRYLRAA